MYAINIKWDTDGDEKLKQELPSSMKIPDEIKDDLDLVSDYISNKTGFCHDGFDVLESI